MRWPCALLSVTLLQACFPSFDVVSEAGAMDAPKDGSQEASGTGGKDATADRAAMESGADAAKCVPVTVAALPAHGGPACPIDGSTCYPGDVTKFSPEWVPPLNGTPRANACTNAEIANFWASCLGPGDTVSACNSFQSADSTCFHCLVTQSTAPEYGPIIYYGGAFPLEVINVAGCIALAEPCNLPCAEAALAYLACNLDACNPGAGPCNGASNAEVLSCIPEAETCGCVGYSIPDNCYMGLVDDPAAHPAVALCNLADAGAFDEANYTAIATFMCGPPS
jgi:hypothetical protein